MKDNKLVLGFVLISLFFSCEKKQLTASDGQDYQTLIVENLIELDEKFEKIEFIKLETTEDCLISWPKKIEIIDDKIVLFDKNQKVFVFDTSGKFLTQIGTIGAGPNELLSISNFFIDYKNKSINLFDRYKSEICQYSLAGELKKRTKIEDAGYFSDIIQVENNMILLSMGNAIGQDNSYRLYDLKKNEKKNELLPFPVVGEQLLYFLPKVACCNNVFYGLSMMSDTIYRYQDECFSPYLLIEGKRKHRDKKIEEEIRKKGPYEVGSDAASVLYNNGYSPGLSSLRSVGSCLYFYFSVDDGYVEILWDTLNDKSYTYKDKKEYESIFYSMEYKFGSTEEAMICLLPTEDVLEEANSQSKNKYFDIDKLTHDMEFDDNPVIGLYYIKRH